MAQERITVDPNRMRGLPCIRDTRVTVSAVLGQLAAGASIDELLADYPYLEHEDVLAALEYPERGRWRSVSIMTVSSSTSTVSWWTRARPSPAA